MSLSPRIYQRLNRLLGRPALLLMISTNSIVSHYRLHLAFISYTIIISNSVNLETNFIRLYCFFSELGNMNTTDLISEVKKLHDEAYQLGLEEAKEMTRGKYLNIFKNK